MEQSARPMEASADPLLALRDRMRRRREMAQAEDAAEGRTVRRASVNARRGIRTANYGPTGRPARSLEDILSAPLSQATIAELAAVGDEGQRVAASKVYPPNWRADAAAAVRLVQDELRARGLR